MNNQKNRRIDVLHKYRCYLDAEPGDASVCFRRIGAFVAGIRSFFLRVGVPIDIPAFR